MIGGSNKKCLLAIKNSTEKINWRNIFCLGVSPAFSFFFSLKQSSMIPIIELPRQNSIVIKMVIPLFLSADLNKKGSDKVSESIIDIRNASPPMVGVPFFDRCQEGPSS